ncbi:MAG: glycosyltransferase [Acidimicrobiales bacterium]|nr:glycosyltransferase [Acidimicrobiales bacterium]
MRIALYHNLPPGGALRYVRDFVARSSLEHDYTEFRPSYVERDWALRPLTNAVSVAKEERRVAAEIDAAQFDVAFVHGCRVMQAPGLLSQLNTPSLYFAAEPRRRNSEPGYRPGSKDRSGLAALAWAPGRAAYDAVLGRRDRRAVADATTLACNSKFTAANVARVYGREATVCYPGVDTGHFRPSSDGVASRSHFLTVGALDPSKGHDLAIDAVARLRQGDRLPLVIVGSRTDDAMAEALQQQARTSGIELVLRTSATEDELVDLYRNAAATLCMAHLEPFGLTVHESVACGTPVVAVREGGFRETVVDGVNGITATRDAGAVAEAITQLAERGLASDPWGLHATVLPWQWDATVRRLHELLTATAERTR